jgi:hypothetical protein
VSLQAKVEIEASPAASPVHEGDAQDLRAGIDFMQLYFGQKVFGQFLNL